jgi:hypothetical protein
MGKTIGERAFQKEADVAQLFERALALHQSGLLPDAKAVYQSGAGSFGIMQRVTAF